MTLQRFSSATSQAGIGLAGLLFTLAIVSCGQSAEDAKRDAAVQRAMNRKKPGYVRLLNLTNRSADLLDKDRPISPTIEAGQATRLSPLRAGEVEVTVKFADKSVAVKLIVESGVGSTIVMFPDHRTAIVSNEQIKPLGDDNVHVAFVAPPGRTVSGNQVVKATSGGKTVELSPDKSDVSLALGDWTVGGSGVSGSANMKVEENLAYTVLLVAGNGGLRPYFLLNTNNDRPAAAGSA